MSQPLPPLRNDLDYIPIEHEGQQFVMVRDPLGLVREGQGIPMPLFHLMANLKPGATISDLQATVSEQAGGEQITTEQVTALVNELDQAYLLASPAFFTAKEDVVNDFVEDPCRPYIMAGRAYPGDPEEIRAWLEATLLGGNPNTQGRIKAIVAPHIDPGIGAGVYARAYAPLPPAQPERVIVLGVGHQMTGGMFSFSQKTFETPLGSIANDTDLSQRLAEAAGNAATADDFAHRSEHSIEFQLLFLQHLLPTPFKLVPILCGSLLYGMEDYTREAFVNAAGPFLEELRKAVDDPGTLLVAGVDFCHVGPKFGHKETARELESETRNHDRELLNALCDCDADAFWEESMRVRDKYNVCGFSALATMLEVLPDCSGNQLGYEIWNEEPTSSAVSYAAMTFTMD